MGAIRLSICALVKDRDSDWLVQALEINLAACASTKEAAKKAFFAELRSTMRVDLECGASQASQVFRMHHPAPKEAFHNLGHAIQDGPSEFVIVRHDTVPEHQSRIAICDVTFLRVDR